jgi:hypothetical protein
MNVVPPRAAVIGTGRSGTGFMAAVLNAAGLNAGHEAYWHSHWGQRASQLDVDVSWLALPLIEAGEWTGPVLHVTRHPVDCVRSLVGTRFFEPSQSRTPYVLYARAHTGIPWGPDPIAAAVEFWCAWNNRCRAVADATIRLEDAGSLMWGVIVAQTLGLGLDAEAVAKGVDATSRTTNTRGPVPEVDPAAVWRLLGRRAHGFGYGA